MDPMVIKENDRRPPKQKVTATPENEEVKKTASALVVNTRNSLTIANVVDFSQHGKLRKLLRVTARVLHFTKNIRPGHESCNLHSNITLYADNTAK